MHIKSIYTQQRCVSLKSFYPFRDLDLGLLVPEADAMSTAPRCQGVHINVDQKWVGLHFERFFLYHRSQTFVDF
jgi:hypothetical protein